MTQSGLIRNLGMAMQFLLVAWLLIWPGQLQADQAQYFYDNLGRLMAVIDGQGNVEVYNYDAVGNLVSIQHFTPSGGGSTGNIGIFFLSPSSGIVGTTVQIQGFGFSSNPSANQVKFNGTPATVTSSTANTIITTVPTGATTGPVTVTNTNGTAISPQPFTMLTPTISAIDPNRVAQGVTTNATITGTNLNNATAVTFTQTGLTATITVASSQSLQVRLTVAGSVPTGPYSFSVTTPNGTAQSGTVTVTVALATLSFGSTQMSVFRPAPSQVPPSNFGMTVTPPISVSMP